MYLLTYKPEYIPWNKGKLVGQKLPLKLKGMRILRLRMYVLQSICLIGHDLVTLQRRRKKRVL